MGQALPAATSGRSPYSCLVLARAIFYLFSSILISVTKHGREAVSS